MNYSKIRLIIRDLDDTLWSGVLGEGKVILKKNIKRFLEKTTRLGLINSINSKNDYNDAIMELRKKKVSKYFVYPNISYEPKGIRLKEQIKKIGISEEFVLFIDDNETNLKEALFYNNNLNILNSKQIGELLSYFDKQDIIVDKSNQLVRYKNREVRDIASQKFDNNIEFLRYSDIKIAIKEVENSDFNRIFELIQKTNQLNFTKIRLTKDELSSLLDDKAYINRAIFECDRFCDNGLIGFYSLKNDKLVHFLFSCRIMNLGIEEYVYEKLKNPKIDVNGMTSNKISSFRKNIDWISETDYSKQIVTLVEKKILFKGPCDMKAILRYMNIGSFLNEMTYIKDDKEMVYQNSIANIYMSARYDENTIERELCYLPFNDIDFFRTKLFSKDIDGVVLSFITLLNTAIYKKKNCDLFFGMGAVSKPFMNPCFDNDYVEGGKNSYNFKNTPENLNYIRENYEYISPSVYLEKYFEQHLRYILTKIKCKNIIILLGNEMKFLKDETNNGVLMFRTMNDIIRNVATANSRISLVDPNLYIDSERDIGNSLNHYSARIYYNMAVRISEVLFCEKNIILTYVDDRRNASENNWRENEYDYK